MKLTGFTVTYTRTSNLQAGIDGICLACLPKQAEGYQGEWKPVFWEEKDMGCAYCGCAMTHDMR